MKKKRSPEVAKSSEGLYGSAKTKVTSGMMSYQKNFECKLVCIKDLGCGSHFCYCGGCNQERMPEKA